MRIILNTEIAVREIDSNLLLACILASQGNDVLVSEQSHLNFLVRFELLAASVFFTKSLHPAPNKISQNRLLVSRGNVVVSQDQESLVVLGTEYALGRFAPDSVGLAPRIFCWGAKDYEFLAGQHPEQVDKFVMSGSPRLDLCHPAFESFWPAVDELHAAESILVCTNFSAVMGRDRFWSGLRAMRDAGETKTSPRLVGTYFEWAKAEASLLRVFYEILSGLSGTFPEKEIVLRPHPKESPEGWASLVADFDNVRVVESGAAMAMIHRSSVVIQSGSTLGIEAHLAGKPVISVEKTRIGSSAGVSRAAHTAGLTCSSAEQVVQAAKGLFDGKPDPALYHSSEGSPFSRPENGLSSMHIADEIMSLESRGLEGKFRFSFVWLAVLCRRLVIFLLKSIRKRPASEVGDMKFAPLDKREMRRKVAWISKHLDLEDLRVFFFPDRRGFLVRLNEVAVREPKSRQERC